jgi:hypothetical protein
MKWKLYTKGAASGGASIVTSSSGGGQTTSAGGGVSDSTASGGGTTETTASGGEHQHRIFVENVNEPLALSAKSYFTNFNDAITATVNLESAESGDIYTYDASGDHSHSINLPSHTHSFNTPDHSHTVDDHTHDIDIDPHTHDMVYGIYKHATLPSAIEITVDGNVIPQTALSGENIDIVPYLSKDSGGRIQRGTWHEITLRPTDDLALINATLIQRLFISSHLGGVY